LLALRPDLVGRGSRMAQRVISGTGGYQLGLSRASPHQLLIALSPFRPFALSPVPVAPIRLILLSAEHLGCARSGGRNPCDMLLEIGIFPF
jgi:hypothetical protein